MIRNPCISTGEINAETLVVQVLHRWSAVWTNSSS